MGTTQKIITEIAFAVVCVVLCAPSTAASCTVQKKEAMLCTVPRSALRSVFSRGPSSDRLVAAVLSHHTVKARAIHIVGSSASTPSWLSSGASSATTLRQTDSGRKPSPANKGKLQPLMAVRSMSSAKPRKWRTGPTSPEWGEGGLRVAPALTGDQSIPSNLKLAVEVWPEEDGADHDGEEDGEHATMIALV